MVAITVILAAVIAAFVFGMAPPPKAPSVQLRVTAVNTSDTGDGQLKLTHNGGDGLILKDEKITVTDAITSANYNVSAVTLTQFQTGTIVDTLGAGASINHTWTSTTNAAPTKGSILKIMIQDIPSGQVITQMQVTVT